MSYLAQDWAILQQAGDPTAKAVLIALAWSLNTKDGCAAPRWRRWQSSPMSSRDTPFWTLLCVSKKPG